jgi:hypothetical protein
VLFPTGSKKLDRDQHEDEVLVKASGGARSYRFCGGAARAWTRGSLGWIGWNWPNSTWKPVDLHELKKCIAVSLIVSG